MKLRKRLVILSIDIFKYLLLIFFDPCRLDRAWLLQTFKGSKCKPAFCDTPDNIIDNMIQAYKSHRLDKAVGIINIVEPGFGGGAMLKKIDASFRHAKITAIEIDPGFFAQVYSFYKKNGALTKTNFINFHNTNFLFWPQKDNDVVFMNPPYDGRRFVKHVEQAISITRPGGVVVSLIPESVFYSISFKSIRFRKKLRKYNTEVSPLGTTVCNYPVPVCMIKIYKK